MGSGQSADEKSLHEFVVKDNKGNEVNLSAYAGKVLLVVNVASKCGFTEQNYTQLTQLHNRYKDKGVALVTDPMVDDALPCLGILAGVAVTFRRLAMHARFEILAFPCNQFLRQEPATSQEVEEFACNTYKVEFPIFQKVCVNGQETAPLYKYLKARKTGFLGSRIKWNFTKFLVDKEGRVINRYGTTTPPLAIEEHIQKALGGA